MVGLLVTLLAVCLCMTAGAPFVRRMAPETSTTEQLALGGLLGLGALGTLTLLVGLLPGGLAWGLWATLPFIAVFAGSGFKTTWSRIRPSETAKITVLLVVVASFGSALNALAPCMAFEWDSLAYHLAVPKIWLQAGQVTYVPGIHQSNFPFVVDMLYVYGLKWGGEAGAKAFSLSFLWLGCAAVFGFLQRTRGARPALWGVVGLIGVPVVLWESGTAYIDLAHGLYAGLGAVYAIEAAMSENGRSKWLPGLLLGLGAASKHTGLQMVLAVVVVLVVASAIAKGRRTDWRLPVSLALIAGAVACPWWAKSAAMTGNPVFPFASSVFSTRDWTPWRAMVYAREQATFGVGKSPSDLGSAVLGLAVQPGRFVNPMQQTGGGSPTGAIGFAVALAAAALLVSGKADRKQSLLMGSVGVMLLTWFFLTQQSRYLTSVAVPLCTVAGAAACLPRFGAIVGGCLALQAVFSVWLIAPNAFERSLPYVAGQESYDAYQSRNSFFFAMAKKLDALPGSGKVALYDEVFGFHLDRPYIWANPGHPTPLSYGESVTPESLVEQLKGQDVVYVYVNLNYLTSAGKKEWAERALANGPELATDKTDPDLHWRYLIAEAAHQGLIKPVIVWPEGRLPYSVAFEVAR